MILITGGTGLIGSHLILQLLQKNNPVRVLFRNEHKKARTLEFLERQGISKEQLLTIEWHEADLLDLRRISHAFKDITHVYHCAARISFDPGDYRSLRKANIEGTANVVNTSIAMGIKKLCYLSSIATLGKTSGDTPITENTPWNPQENNNVYAITKYGAEMEVWRGSQEGLDCVIFNPGVVLGEGLWEQSTAKLFQSIDNGLSFYPSGGTGFVDVKDIVRAMIMGMESDLVNEKFILVGANLSFRELFTMIARQINKKPPGTKAPAWLLELLWRLDWFKSTIFRLPRKLSRASARSASRTDLYDSDKAVEKLGLKYTPVDDTLARIANYHYKESAISS